MLEHLRGLAVFARTVEAGSFRGAARSLGLSPSVISHHVAQLEASLGVVLLNRSTRKLGLTGEGARLLESAKAMVAAAQSGLDGVVLNAGNLSGRLSVAAPSALVSGPVLDDLAAFALAFPRVSLSLAFSDAPVDLIGGAVDVAIRAGALKDSSLKARRLGSMPRTLVAGRDLVASRPTAKHPRDLADWPWVRLASRPAVATFRRPGQQPVEVEFTARLTVDSAEAGLQLAARGLGLSTQPTTAVQAGLREGRVVEVLPDWPLEAPATWAVWPAQAPRLGLAMRLVDFLVERERRRG